MNVLAITDNQETVKDMSFCLRPRWQESTIVSAAEGPKGIVLIETEGSDLVVADMSLKDIDWKGWSFGEESPAKEVMTIAEHS